MVINCSQWIPMNHEWINELFFHEHLPCQGWAPFNQGLSEWNISADFAPHEHHVCRHVAAQDSLVMTRQCLLPVAALMLCLSLLSITWTSPYGEVKILYQKFRSSTLTSSNTSSPKKSDQFLNSSTKKSVQFLSPPSDPGNVACLSPSAAFCIAGLARSFFLPAVHLSQKRNLVDAFGAKRSDVFLLLKLGNPEAKADGWYNPRRAAGCSGGDVTTKSTVCELWGATAFWRVEQLQRSGRLQTTYLSTASSKNCLLEDGAWRGTKFWKWHLSLRLCLLCAAWPRLDSALAAHSLLWRQRALAGCHHHSRLDADDTESAGPKVLSAFVLQQSHYSRGGRGDCHGTGLQGSCYEGALPMHGRWLQPWHAQKLGASA